MRLFFSAPFNLFGKFTQLTISAALGLFAYPSQGIYKSIYASTHGGTSKNIATARREEGSYLLPRHDIDLRRLLQAWEECGGKYAGT